MSLVLTPQSIGTGWQPVELGDRTYTLDQWRNPLTREWKSVPWFSQDNFACRSGQNLRRPMSFRAKLESIWSARSKLFARYILRKS